MAKRNTKGSTGFNKKNSDQYIAKYAAKAEVEQTQSGLFYRIIEPATGAPPTMEGSVRVNQRVWLADGTVIADTYKSGEADIFTMGEAIPGLQEGLQMMAEGARYEFVVPPELAWGKKGVGRKIGPYAVLTFDIRLLEIIF